MEICTKHPVLLYVITGLIRSSRSYKSFMTYTISFSYLAPILSSSIFNTNGHEEAWKKFTKNGLKGLFLGRYFISYPGIINLKIKHFCIL